MKVRNIVHKGLRKLYAEDEDKGVPADAAENFVRCLHSSMTWTTQKYSSILRSEVRASRKSQEAWSLRSRIAIGVNILDRRRLTWTLSIYLEVYH